MSKLKFISIEVYGDYVFPKGFKCFQILTRKENSIPIEPSN